MKKCMLMAVLAVVLLLATNASAQIPDFTASGKATVSVEPASTPGLRPGDAFSVNVTVDPGGKGVSGAEVKIAFDASVVECEDVSPGDLLGDSLLEKKKVIDNENGMIWYELYRRGSTPVPTEEGTFAILYFKVKGDAPEGTYYLRITSAKLTDENFAYISPIEIENGTFTIVPPPTNITFSDLRVEPTEGVAPLEIGVCAQVENNGGSAGEYNATLKIDGEVVDYKTGTLSAGESKRVCFNYTFTETGTYNVTIDGLPPVEVNVREKVVPTVSVEPAPTPLCPGDVFSVNVTVDPAGKGISGAEVKIAFDASVVECEDVSPGDLLGDSPIQGKKEIDNENGTIWYALARIGDTPVPTEEGTLAVLSFKVKEDAPEGTYYLRITSAKLTDENFAYISPIRTENGTFTIVFEEGPHITITTDKTEYTTGDIILANITIANPTEETKHVIFNWWVTVPSKGFYTAPLATTPMTLPPSYNTTLTYTITVGYWGADNFSAVFCVALTNQTSGKIISSDATFWNYEARGAREAGEKSIESIVSEIKRSLHH